MKTFEKKWTSLMKKLSLILSSLAIVILFSFSFSYSDEKNIIKGNAIVVDGDTIKINGKKIRFGGIDAPESYFKGKKQTCIEDNKEVFCGQISKNKLIKKISYYLLSVSIVLELLHIVIPNRGFEVADLLGNALGVILSLILYKLFTFRRSK